MSSYFIRQGHRPLNETQAQEVMLAVTDAVLYCHKIGVVHKDIKLENLVLTDCDLSRAIVKLSDFGLS